MVARGKKKSLLSVPRWSISLRLFALALVTLAAVATCAYLLIAGGDEKARKGTAALVKAFRARRLIEPRLMGGFEFARYEPLSRESVVGQSPQVAEVDESALEEAIDLLTGAASNRQDAQAQHAYARLLLIRGDTLRAQKILKGAASRLPKDKEAYNDLGACLIEMGRLEEALDELNKALKDDPVMREALFNRALCYQRFHLRDAALADLRQLEQVESDQGWLSEVRRQADELSQPLKSLRRESEVVGAFKAATTDEWTEEARNLAEEQVEIIQKYATGPLCLEILSQVGSGDKEQAQKSLSVMEHIGKTQDETVGEALVLDLANYLKGLDEQASKIESDLITTYLKAESDYNAGKYSETKDTFERLCRTFKERGNHIFYGYSLCNLVGNYYSLVRLNDSIKLCKEGLAFIEKKKWPYLLSQFYNSLAISLTRSGQDSQAIKYHEKGLSLCKNIYISEAKKLQYLGVAYRHIGSLEKGIASLSRSTDLFIKHYASPRQLSYNFLLLAEFYKLYGNQTLPRLLAKQSLSFSEQIKDFNRAAQASSFLAIESARQGEFSRSEGELAMAFEYLGKLGQKPSPYTGSLVYGRAGEIALQAKNTEKAKTYFTMAEAALAGSEEAELNIINVLPARAEAFALSKDYPRARRDLDNAIKIIQSYRESLPLLMHRSDFLDVSQGVFDQLISISISALNDQKGAFDLSEQSRARTLLDEIALQDAAAGKSAKHKISPLRLGDVQRGLPEDVTLLEYSVTNQGTHLFRLTRSDFDSKPLRVTTEQIEQMVRDFVADLSSESSSITEIKKKGQALYDILIKPVEERLKGDNTVCVVADKWLHFLPFGALVDGSGKYLIETKRLMSAPSASVLIRCIEEGRKKPPASPERILAVGNPRFDESKFPGLRSLHDAEQESIRAASFYPPSTRVVLNGKDATKDRVLSELMKCSVAHLALHTLIEEDSPWLAALVLATPPADTPSDRTERDDELLYLSDAYNLSLSNMRLVILSSCESGLGQYYRGEGIVSLVRPFLALQVPTVVASLWPVDSQAASELMVEFHRQRVGARLRAGDALCAAQRRMAGEGSLQHPYYWAPFIAVGSNN